MSLTRRPALGFRGLPAPDGGVVVTDLDGGSPAAAMLRPGDRLLAIDDLPVEHPRAIAVMLRGRRAGETVTLRLVRDGEPRFIQLVLTALPEETCPDAHVHYDSIQFSGGRLRTITTRPTAAAGRVPAVLLLPDLACVSQDFALAPGQPAQAIVAALAAAGVASMRVERPGLGDSEGGPCEALGWHDEVAMFRAGLAALASDPAIDPDALGLFGHGVGGTLAPAVGAEERARRVIVFGTCARRWSACVRRRAGPADVDANMLTRARAGRLERYTDELETVDLPAAWRALHADVLVLHGGRDERIDHADAHALADLLARRSTGATRFLEFAEIDHTLAPASPTLLAAIAAFAAGTGP